MIVYWENYHTIVKEPGVSTYFHRFPDYFFSRRILISIQPQVRTFCSLTKRHRAETLVFNRSYQTQSVSLFWLVYLTCAFLLQVVRGLIRMILLADWKSCYVMLTGFEIYSIDIKFFLLRKWTVPCFLGKRWIGKHVSLLLRTSKVLRILKSTISSRSLPQRGSHTSIPF